MPEDNAAGTAEEKLLKEIRDDYAYHRDYWRENREASAIDSQYMACEGWTADDKAERAGRPCIWPDELSQHVKQATNNWRKNKRAIQIIPRGSGATDKDARHRASYIRAIEHASNAASIYTTAHESCVECAFGFYRVKLVYTTEIDGKRYQEPRLARIPNLFTVLPDPDAREADFSDSRRYFVLDSMRQKAFGRKYPKARKKSFTKDDFEAAPDWFSGDNLVLAEAWRAEGDEWPYKVTQHITNGVEILETNEWIGGWIPIIGVFGEELYVNEGGKSKRVFMSLIRRALGAQKMLAFTASQEAEEFGMSPRAPFLGFKGQFDPEKWKYANKVPYAYLETEIPADWNPAWGAPPVPSRPQFTPQIQAYEAAFERWRRSVQAAVGINPLPTAAQRQNQKSGIALDKIEDQAAIGSFHFSDNSVRAQINAGRQLNDLITQLAKLDSLPPEVPILKKDQTNALLKVVNKQAAPDGQGDDQDDYLVADLGEFDVTVSTGPSSDSERDESGQFLDNLIANIGSLPFIPQPVALKILGLAIKLKPTLGAIGEQISDLLSPPDNQQIPPQAQAAVAQAQGMLQQLQQELQKAQEIISGKQVEQQGKLAIAQLQAQVDVEMGKLKALTPIIVAEINTKAQDARLRGQIDADVGSQLHDGAHEIAMQKDQQAHEAAQAQQAQAAASAQADQGHEQALEQQQQAADLAPKPQESE